MGQELRYGQASVVYKLLIISMKPQPLIVFMYREWLRKAVTITIEAINSRNIPQQITLSVNLLQEQA